MTIPHAGVMPNADYTRPTGDESGPAEASL
jgi:hypothetical protein